MKHATFNPMHLGDNLVHLHFLRALAKAHPDHHFTHGAPDQHLAQLAPLCWDLGNLTLTSISHTPQGAINAWRGTEGHWYGHPQRNDFARYHLRWFEVLANRMGLASPFTKPADLLFDYPELAPSTAGTPLRGEWGRFDFLIINSEPKSGQWSGFSARGLASLAQMLHDRGETVITTADTHDVVPCTQGYDVTAIGRLSQRVKCIIGCVTGPMWPTLSVFNNPSTLRIHLLDEERVEIAPNTVHTNSIRLAAEILHDRGLL